MSPTCKEAWLQQHQKYADLALCSWQLQSSNVRQWYQHLSYHEQIVLTKVPLWVKRK